MQQQTIADLQDMIEIYCHLACAQDDIINGRVQPLSEAMDDIRKVLYDLNYAST
ncbi:MAG: hypothetical protein K2O04_00845 [Clostridiales bacterium]|nr:hypothetical protein [Clostridiales bacterium]